MSIKKLKNIIAFKMAASIPHRHLYLNIAIKDVIKPIGPSINVYGQVGLTGLNLKGILKLGNHTKIPINIHPMEIILQVLKSKLFDASDMRSPPIIVIVEL
ncbi:hypothetical protein CBC_A1847 [Clostridium botulinum C str. Eklund]|nr:hypothetical protein CBC_A1847 [Clostridium botulinum C str. Eklund]